MSSKPLKYFLLYVLSIMAALLSMAYFSSCTSPKEIQVQLHVWRLIDKIPASRWAKDGDNDFVWLVWMTDREVPRYERVTVEAALCFFIGETIINRDNR